MQMKLIREGDIKIYFLARRKDKIFVSQILRRYVTNEGRVRKLFCCLA